jgi:plasmid maintenance system killer protein
MSVLSARATPITGLDSYCFVFVLFVREFGLSTCALQLHFRDPGLAELATNKNAQSRYGEATDRKYRQRVQQIVTALDEHEFCALKSLHYKKLKGHNQFSIRLNDQCRLILKFEGDRPNKKVLIVAIEDWHV